MIITIPWLKEHLKTSAKENEIIDRLAMLKYGINDLRAFFEADYRWLSHFGFDPLDVPTNYRGLSK